MIKTMLDVLCIGDLHFDASNKIVTDKLYQNANNLVLLDVILTYYVDVRDSDYCLELILRGGNPDQLRIFDSSYSSKVSVEWEVENISHNSIECSLYFINYMFSEGISINLFEYFMSFGKFNNPKLLKRLLFLVEDAYFETMNSKQCYCCSCCGLLS